MLIENLLDTRYWAKGFKSTVLLHAHGSPVRVVLLEQKHCSHLPARLTVIRESSPFGFSSLTQW